MSNSLTLSSKRSPFPFAVIAIAAYTGKAELNFDEDSTDVSLEVDGTRVTDDAEIVQSLAKAGGLAEDSVKVRFLKCGPHICALTYSIDTSILCIGKIIVYPDHLQRDRRCS